MCIKIRRQDLCALGSQHLLAAKDIRQQMILRTECDNMFHVNELLRECHKLYAVATREHLQDIVKAHKVVIEAIAPLYQLDIPKDISWDIHALEVAVYSSMRFIEHSDKIVNASIKEDQLEWCDAVPW